MMLEGRSAIITGGSRGIGRAIALEFARQGADIALVARNASELEGTRAEVAALGRECVVFATDVRVRQEVQVAVAGAIAALGPIDALVNCAGVGIGPVPVEDTTDEQWRLILDTNLRGPLMFVQEIVPHFIEYGRGSIVNVSSLGAKYKPGATSAAYVASKSALCGLTRQLARKLGSHGIRVNAVLPGNTVLEKADLSWSSLSEDAKARMLRSIPLGRFGRPEDQAPTVVWLASDYSSWVTGETIGVSGGERMG